MIAFGGRVLGDDKPKYLNSPETDIFHKGRELYGFYEALQANRRMDLADAVGQGLSSDQSIEENAQARRDAARENAVGVAGLNQQQKMVDTYMNASSSGDSGSSSSLANPGTVYQETLQANRRMDLADAAGQGHRDRQAGFGDRIHRR